MKLIICLHVVKILFEIQIIRRLLSRYFKLSIGQAHYTNNIFKEKFKYFNQIKILKFFSKWSNLIYLRLFINNNNN